LYARVLECIERIMAPRLSEVLQPVIMLDGFADMIEESKGGGKKKRTIVSE
jgi:hypothetical protein